MTPEEMEELNRMRWEYPLIDLIGFYAEARENLGGWIDNRKRPALQAYADEIWAIVCERVNRLENPT